MKPHYIVLAILIFAMPRLSIAQIPTTPQMISPQTNEIIPPAPSSAQQMRYQSPQPSLATGAVSLSIPLYNLEVEGVSIPFTMAYQTSGIKPLDDPFPFGYGWSLQPALRVTRTVRGRADEQFRYVGDSIANHLLYTDKRLGFACMVSNDGHASTIKERYDAEKDIFTISLPSTTLTRIIRQRSDGKFEFLGGGADDEYSISATGDKLEEITVTDPYGVRYVFGGSFTEIPQIVDSDRTVLITTWGIKEIQLPSGRKISFEWSFYSPHDKQIYGGDAIGDKFDPLGNRYSPQEIKTLARDRTAINPRGNYVKRLRISSVSFPGGKIILSYQDCMLRSFRVTAGSDIVRQVSLDYNRYKYDLYFLKELTLSGEGTYRFEYNPFNIENKQYAGGAILYNLDWWGYYNGRIPKDGRGYVSLSPQIRLKTFPESARDRYVYEYVGEADRRPDADSMQAGILRKIIYPTGGISTFDYEPHRFPSTKVDSHGNIDNSSDPALDFGGGLRVKKITTYTSTSDPSPQIRTYLYDSVVVTAVPSAATFVSVVDNAVGLYIDPVMYIQPHFYRLTTVRHESDYMHNHIGEEPIWYRKVTEIHNEGKIEYVFSQINPTSTEEREWGKLFPKELNNVFSKGIRLREKRIFKNAGTSYNKVETSIFDYESTGGDRILNSFYIRDYIQAAVDESEAPDFYDAEMFTYFSDINKNTPVHFYLSNYIGMVSPYNGRPYSINLISERLASKTVTQHFDNGDFSQTETYSYKPGTSIITSVETSTSGDSRTDRIDLDYAVSGRNSAETAMVNANAIGIPVKTTRTFGTAVTAVRREMKNYSNRIFRPSREWLSRGSVEWLAGQYGYDSFGNIREYRGTDSVPSVYLWGYEGRHPVYRIDGASYSEVLAKGIGTDAINGSAEKTDILSKLSDWLVTRALWRPLVGVTSLRQPSGLTSSYTYDSAGRLTQTAIDGHGPIEQYDYHINDNGRNYTRHRVFDAADDNTLREIINYDGLGRETSRLSRFPGTPRLVVEDRPVALAAIDMPSTPILLRMGYTAQLTEYDSSDRPCRTWSPVMVYNNSHPTAAEIKDAAKSHYGTDYAYTSTIYEASPRGLVNSTRKAGQEWHDADRRVTVRTLTNTASGDYSCYEYYAASETSQTLSRRLYPAGSLTVEETIDEEGHRTLVFKDCRGLTVMTREGDSSDWHDTRYVYNDFGDLRFVIQPNQPLVRSTPQDRCFRYSYDERGRLTFKALPQCEGTTYYYDSRSRLFAEQDGNMRADGRFLLHFYDRYGRDVLKAFVNTGESTIKTLCGKSLVARRSGSIKNSTTGGHVIDGGFTFPVSEFAEARYYDSYDFLNDLNLGWQYKITPVNFTKATQAVKGMPTGLLAGDRLTVTQYDDAGRIVRTAYGGTAAKPENVTLFRHNYEGKVIEERNTANSGSVSVSRTIVRSYFDSGHPWTVRVIQNGDSARIAYDYDDAGLLSKVTYGSDIDRTMTYNVNGWLTSWTVDAPVKKVGTLLPFDPIALNTAKAQIKYTVESETLHYADSGSDYTARYDGRISSRKRGSDLTAYTYDIHGRLTQAKTVNNATDGRDFSTSYSYDNNANILTIARKGVTDIVGSSRTYGSHNSVTMSYGDYGNRLSSMTVTRAGADYEGRTGLPATDGAVSGFAYDSNGNLTKDPSRDIVLIKYNHLNLPVDVYFGNGQRQTIDYDGSGVKRSVSYSQTTAAIVGGSVPSDDRYTVTSTRTYVGSHIFTDGALEYSSFEGGYIDPAKGVMYYITDWQGNNAAVIDKSGDIVQSTTYYPYGEPTIEPRGQRFLFGGKEREHAAGRNSYDFGARNLAANAWTTPDPLAEKFHHISPYSYCLGDPINKVDPTGKLPFDKSVVNKRISSGFGWRIHPKTGKSSLHGGIDLSTDGTGHDVHVIADGTIKYIGWNEKLNEEGKLEGYGRYVVVAHADGYETLYAHLEKDGVSVSVGDAVSENDVIAKSGNTGGSTGPHLHIEIAKGNIFTKGNKLDPASIPDLQLLLHPDNFRVILNEVVATAKAPVQSPITIPIMLDIKKEDLQIIVNSKSN